jgi:hypothetical protein
MDRSGFNPNAVAEKQVSLKNVLRIQVLDEFGAGKSVNIELDSTIGGDNGDSTESLNGSGGQTIHDSE